MDRYVRKRKHEDLKPCPFCGKDTAVLIGDGSGNEVTCDDPDCPVMREGGWTKQFAIALWNKRPIEDALRKEIAEQKDVYEVIEQKLNDTCDNVVWYKAEIARKDELLAVLNLSIEARDSYGIEQEINLAHKDKEIQKLIRERDTFKRQAKFAQEELEEIKKIRREEI